MSTTVDELDRVEGAVLQTLQQNGTRWAPTDLIERLTHEGWSEDLVRIAIWYLIDRTEIVLTLDWKLVLPEHGQITA